VKGLAAAAALVVGQTSVDWPRPMFSWRLAGIIYTYTYLLHQAARAPIMEKMLEM
jgi:hypothetical protein